MIFLDELSKMLLLKGLNTTMHINSVTMKTSVLKFRPLWASLLTETKLLPLLLIGSL